jgi:GNAT superfamily N-acetyltransferase
VKIRVTHTSGIVILADPNTTIAYCRYTDAGEVEYIFVNPAHRRKGYAKQLLSIVEGRVQRSLRFQTPISPLGRKLLDFYNQCQNLRQHGNAPPHRGAEAPDDSTY